MRQPHTMKYTREQRTNMPKKDQSDRTTSSPTDISPQAEPMSQDETSGLVYFWRPSEVPYGFLCQWYTSYFRDSRVHESHTFNCAEQYMMYRKALVLATLGSPGADGHGSSKKQVPSTSKSKNRPSDGRRAQISNAQNDPSRLPIIILAEQDPGRQKALARSIRFTPTQLEQWNNMKFDVVVEGNYHKFTQNEELRRQLLATGKRELVEASPQDDVWGIGHAAEFAELHREHWGSNLLGKALMVVRKRLREEVQS